jgi:hypothetical protein
MYLSFYLLSFSFCKRKSISKIAGKKKGRRDEYRGEKFFAFDRKYENVEAQNPVGTTCA